MKYGIYVIKDEKTTWLTPHVDFNDSSAMRNFCQAVCTKDSQMNFAKSDFSLWKLGEFDNETGLIVCSNSCLLLRGDDVGEV